MPKSRIKQIATSKKLRQTTTPGETASDPPSSESCPNRAVLSAGLPFHPPLAITVLGIFDVLSRMEQSVTIKAVIDIAGMRHIPSCDNAHERVILADAHFSSIRRASSPGWLSGS